MTGTGLNKTIRVTVPGRVNLIGEWIDFNGGTVLPMALNQAITLEMRANDRDEDTVSSRQFGDPRAFSLTAPAEGHWSDYVRGGLQYARENGWLTGGFDVTLDSTIPVGAGLSSSAATVVATLKAASLDRTDYDPVAIAMAAKDIENNFIGVPCGIMDQMAVAIGAPGEVIALDTRDRSFEIVPLPSDWCVVVVHSGIARALADGRYKQRRDECLLAAEALQLEHLCDADVSAIARLPAELARRGRHVVSEGARARDSITALKAGDRLGFGQLMQASHASLRDDFEVSVPEIDAMVADAITFGADGARITGAGFGGCFVCLLSPEKVDVWWQALLRRHPGISRVA